MDLLTQFAIAALSFLAGATQHVGDTCLTVKGPPPIIITVDNSVIGTLPVCPR
jgi:hypothetical protein